MHPLNGAKMLLWVMSVSNVDEANVDTSSFVESSRQWIWGLEAWAS